MYNINILYNLFTSCHITPSFHIVLYRKKKNRIEMRKPCSINIYKKKAMIVQVILIMRYLWEEYVHANIHALSYICMHVHTAHRYHIHNNLYRHCFVFFCIYLSF